MSWYYPFIVNFVVFSIIWMTLKGWSIIGCCIKWLMIIQRFFLFCSWWCGQKCLNDSANPKSVSGNVWYLWRIIVIEDMIQYYCNYKGSMEIIVMFCSTVSWTNMILLSKTRIGSKLLSMAKLAFLTFWTLQDRKNTGRLLFSSSGLLSAWVFGFVSRNFGVGMSTWGSVLNWS